ncbi:MAG: hypothetical protein K9M51_01275 [Candidatus Gracilibacteria bacterium]|nr:hypothetical protein [Candidatus Gracilibacteria bacterium]
MNPPSPDPVRDVWESMRLLFQSHRGKSKTIAFKSSDSDDKNAPFVEISYVHREFPEFLITRSVSRGGEVISSLRICFNRQGGGEVSARGSGQEDFFTLEPDEVADFLTRSVGRRIRQQREEKIRELLRFG